MHKQLKQKIMVAMLIAMSSAHVSAADYEDSTIGKVLNWLKSLLGGVFELLVAFGVLAGFWFVLSGILDKTMESRNEEGWVKKLGGGVAAIAVCGGLLATVLNDSGANSDQSFQTGSFLDSGSSSGSGSTGSAGTPGG